MAEGLVGLDTTFKAAADLSSYQYHFVYLSAANTVNVAGANARTVGILQNKPNAAGESATVRILGLSKLVAGEIIDRGTMITAKSDGHGEEADAASEWVGAIAIEAAGAANDVITVKLAAFDAHESDA